MEKCFFCDCECKDYIRMANYNSSRYQCDNCGFYWLFNSAIKTASDNKHIIAGFLYETNRQMKLLWR